MAIKFPATIELDINNKPEKFQLNFKICENPDCNCKGINIALYNETKKVVFFLDFVTGYYREDNYSEDDVVTIKALLNFLKSNENNQLNLGLFKMNYKYVKEQVRNKKDTIDSFEIGTFLLYRDVLWKEVDLNMNINGKNYAVFDSYCVTPDCDCQDVSLNFFEDVHKLGIREPSFSFVYSYMTQTYKDIVGISNAQVKNIISLIHGSLNRNFKKRHVNLKKEVKKDIQRKIKERGFIHSGKIKIGRNELCYCGSGRKYKKCCLDKDVGRYVKAIKEITDG